MTVLHSYKVLRSDIKAMEQEFQFYLSGNSGSFTTHLFSALVSADASNFNRLASAFPVHAYVVNEAYRGHLSDKFEVVDSDD